MKNMLAKRREELEKEVFDRAVEIEDYIVENTSLGKKITFGHINKNNKEMEYWIRNDNGILEGSFSCAELVKYEGLIKTKIDGINEEMIKEMRDVLDG